MLPCMGDNLGFAGRASSMHARVGLNLRDGDIESNINVRFGRDPSWRTVLSQHLQSTDHSTGAMFGKADEMYVDSLPLSCGDCADIADKNFGVIPRDVWV